MDLIFDKVSFQPSDEITGIAPKSGFIEIFHLGVLISKFDTEGKFNLGRFPVGGYSIAWNDDSGQRITSAFEVLVDPWTRLRYGFVAEFTDEVNTDNYLTWAKKLHLTAIQFYDWAWRHEILTTDKLHYGDPLGNIVSTNKIRELISGYQKMGATPCGYVAVYAVDAEGWKRWEHAGLFDSEGLPYQLGENFLWILDPANSTWLDHLISQLRLARDFGFPGFHLDQYGWPKSALTSEGTPVDLAGRFPEMLNKIVSEIPECKYIFNNVNDFPTWSTTQTSQDATYIEVWEPHTSYDHLANLVTKARELNPKKPVVISAYLSSFASIGKETRIEEATASFELAFASICSGGAAHLITGGDGRILQDPYYVRNFHASKSVLDTIQNYFDFVVAAGDLLFDPTRIDVTLIYAFGINNEIKFSSNVPLSPEAAPGYLWIRIYKGKTGLSIHVINLTDQKDALWDGPKSIISKEAKIAISIDAAGFSDRVSIGSGSCGAAFESRTMEKSGNRLKIEVEVRGAWTIVNIPLISG